MGEYVIENTGGRFWDEEQQAWVWVPVVYTERDLPDVLRERGEAPLERYDDCYEDPNGVEGYPEARIKRPRPSMGPAEYYRHASSARIAARVAQRHQAAPSSKMWPQAQRTLQQTGRLLAQTAAAGDGFDASDLLTEAITMLGPLVVEFKNQGLYEPLEAWQKIR